MARAVFALRKDLLQKTLCLCAQGEVLRVSSLFEEAGICFEDGQIVEEGRLAKTELVELADQLLAETFTPAFVQEFAALSPGLEVKIRLADAQPGLQYAVGASATLEGLGQAVRDAQKVGAPSEGVELTALKREKSRMPKDIPDAEKIEAYPPKVEDLCPKAPEMW